MSKLSLEKQVNSLTDGHAVTTSCVTLKSKADNTVKSYISGFHLWRVWSENVEDMMKLSLEKQVNSITGGQLQPLVSLLPDVLLKSKADNTVKYHISGFNL